MGVKYGGVGTVGAGGVCTVVNTAASTAVIVENVEIVVVSKRVDVALKVSAI